MKIAIVNGPNLNLLGTREPEIYGRDTLSDMETNLKNSFPDIDFVFFQSNGEKELIEFIQQLKTEKTDGLVINGGGFSHTSVALADAVKAVGIPCISVHISNIYAREDYRSEDILGTACMGSIIGLGMKGYAFAVEVLRDKIGGVL